MRYSKGNSVNIFVIILLLLLAAFSVYFFVIRNSLAPTDSSAANTGKLVLQLLSPSSLVGQPVNTSFNVGISAQNLESDKVSEIVLKFDPVYLEGVSISEDLSLLALNKNINNTDGQITIDIARSGDANFTANSNLVTFGFKIKNNSTASTTISVAQGSSLGYPNRLASDGYGTLNIAFQNQPTIVCGDGSIGGSEQCDSGSNNGVACQPGYGATCNYCTSSCTLTTLEGIKCGDGIKNGSELCDDGNQNNTDACSNQCTTTGIGAPGNTNTSSENNTGSTGNSNSNTGSNTNNTNTGSTNTNNTNTSSNTNTNSTNNNVATSNTNVDSNNSTQTNNNSGTNTTTGTEGSSSNNTNTGSNVTNNPPTGSSTSSNSSNNTQNTTSNSTSSTNTNAQNSLIKGMSNQVLIGLLVFLSLGIIVTIIILIKVLLTPSKQSVVSFN